MPLSSDDILGTWVLDEWYIEGEDGGRTYPMGRDAQGIILYTDDGCMSAIVRAKDRFLPADRPTDEDRIEAFSSYVNYAGTWQIEEGSVVHRIEHALDPNLQGLSLARAVSFDEGRMIFTGPAPRGDSSHVIVWKRRQP